MVNACAAALAVEGRLSMDDADVAAVHKACPAAKTVVSHMDSVTHAAITRAGMRLLSPLLPLRCPRVPNEC